MKAKICVLLAGVFVACFFAQVMLAQAQEQKPQLWFVEDMVVKPSKINDFEAVTKDFNAVFKKYGFPYPMNTYSSDDFHYYLFYPVENLSDLQKAYEIFGDIGKKLGEANLQALMKRQGDAIEYYKQYFLRTMPELSYLPKKPRLKPEEKSAFIWDIYYCVPGREKEVEELGKEWMQLLKSKNYNDEVLYYIGDIGTEFPVYYGVLFAKDFADLYAQNKKMWELMGDEGGKLYDKMMPLVRKREGKSGWYRPELSFTPEKKATQ